MPDRGAVTPRRAGRRVIAAAWLFAALTAISLRELLHQDNA